MIAAFIVGAAIFGLGVLVGASVVRTNLEHILKNGDD